MNILIISILLISIINFISCININSNNFRNVTFKVIIFKKKTLPKIFYKLQNFYNKCYNKSIVSVSEGINEYNNLSDEDRLIIDFIISSIL